MSATRNSYENDENAYETLAVKLRNKSHFGQR
jgi:hypothetical protein